MRLLVVLLGVAGATAAASIPSGTQIQIRLTAALNTAKAQANQSFEAVVIAPVVVNGQIAMAAGATVTGHITEVKAANQTSDQAVLSLAFDQIRAGTRKANLPAKLASVDNARESVDSDGKITGIKASDTGSARMDQGINKVTQKYPGLGDLLSTVKQAVVKETDANIDFEPGVEMTLELTKPLEWSGDRTPNIPAVQPEAELLQAVSRQPFRTTAEKPPRPSDVTNLMFLGSQQEIAAAFEKAGWASADRLNSSSKLETFRAIVEERGYKEAPVSTLLLDGAPPDQVFQKQNDTFSARHHLRIWRQPGSFHGLDIWVCAATHDIGIDFSEQNRTFIHKIDSNVDRERAKVVSDLLFTGLVRALSLVDRDIPSGLSNATGDAIQTDGRIAVVVLGPGTGSR